MLVTCEICFAKLILILNWFLKKPKHAPQVLQGTVLFLKMYCSIPLFIGLYVIAALQFRMRINQNVSNIQIIKMMKRSRVRVQAPNREHQIGHF